MKDMCCLLRFLLKPLLSDQDQYEKVNKVVNLHIFLTGRKLIESRILSCTMASNVEPISFTISGELTKGDPSWANYVKVSI